MGKSIYTNPEQQDKTTTTIYDCTRQTMFKQMFTLSSVHVPFIGVAWQATLAVWAETDGATKQRLHGLARALAESGRGWVISWKLHENQLKTDG